MIFPIAFQSMLIDYDKPRTLQSNDNMFPFMCLKYHTAWAWIWAGQKVWKEDQGGAVAQGGKYFTCQ